MKLPTLQYPSFNGVEILSSPLFETPNLLIAETSDPSMSLAYIHSPGTGHDFGASIQQTVGLSDTKVKKLQEYFKQKKLKRLMPNVSSDEVYTIAFLGSGADMGGTAQEGEVSNGL